MNYDFKSLEQKCADTKEWLKREYSSLRTGRANPALLDSIKVNAYGSLMPLKQVANITVEDARSLRIIPWDAALVKDIERAIAQADLGVGTGSDNAGVRVTVPELTSERREQLVKVAKQKLEEARTAVRIARDEVWKDIQDKEREGEISEDDKFRLKEEMQKKIDTTNGDLEQVFGKKEQEMNS